jgi:hypothetical protein
MIKYLSVAAVLAWICSSEAQVAACDGCNFTPFSRAVAFNDSLSAVYPNDTSYGSALKTEALNSTLCFIAHIQSIRQCSIASAFTETLTVVCDTRVHGPALPKTFDVLNRHHRLWKQDCLDSARRLGTQKFLCILGTGTMPGELCSLGVYVGQCSGVQGTFVTQQRIVSFNSQCSSYTNTCWDTPVFAGLGTLVDRTGVNFPIRRSGVSLNPNNARMESRVFDLSGRQIQGNSKTGLRVVVKNRKVQIQYVR